MPALHSHPHPTHTRSLPAKVVSNGHICGHGNVRRHQNCAHLPFTPTCICFQLAPHSFFPLVLSLQVLCMTVECGWGGLKFQPQVLAKVRQLRSSYPSLDLQVDGGINAETSPLAAEAGANIVVAGGCLS